MKMLNTLLSELFAVVLFTTAASTTNAQQFALAVLVIVPLMLNEWNDEKMRKRVRQLEDRCYK